MNLHTSKTTHTTHIYHRAKLFLFTFRYKIVCRPFYRTNGTIQKLSFQLAIPEPQDPDCYPGYIPCRLYKKPEGTFEFLLTNGEKFDTVFSPLYKSTGTKLSIKSSRFINFDLHDIVDKVSIYLHTSVVVQKY